MREPHLEHDRRPDEVREIHGRRLAEEDVELVEESLGALAAARVAIEARESKRGVSTLRLRASSRFRAGGGGRSCLLNQEDEKRAQCKLMKDGHIFMCSKAVASSSASWRW